MNQHKNIKLMGAALGWGAQRHETELAADIYYQAHLASIIEDLTAKHCHWHKIIYPTIRHASSKTLDYAERLAQIIEFNQQLGKALEQQIEAKQFCVVLGGDHAMAIGTWSGTLAALKANQAFGLLWVDAHMDAHTPETTPSHAIHGMPLAVLLGHGEPGLVNLMNAGPKLSPKHVVLFGIRSFEPEEAALLASLKVRIYFMEEIRDRGVDLCLQEAIEIINQAPKGFGISLDLDAFDPLEAPGVGSPEPHGLFSDGFVPALKNAFSHPNFKALEIAEYNPTRDINQKTLKLTQKILSLL